MKLSKEIKESLTKEQYRFYKANGYLPTIKTDINNSTEQINTDTDKLTVLCVRFGSGYGKEYVEKLRNMVARHLTVPYEFVCLTDDQHPINGVRSIVQKNQQYRKQWWHKVHMFDPSLSLSGRILYFDLDVIICSSINKLVFNLNNEFHGIRDFNRNFFPHWQMLNSSTMSWMHGSQSDIYDIFKANPNDAIKLHGDQDWIWKIAKPRIKFWKDSWIQSYKWEIRKRDELVSRDGRRGFKTVATGTTVDPNCAVAVFHGSPNPSDVVDTFVLENWR